MKKFTSLIFAVICIAMMIGEWVWLFSLPSDSGSLGQVVLIPPMIIICIGLFIVSIIHIGKFFKSFKTAASPEGTDIPASYITKKLPQKKNFIALAGAIVQIAMIVAAAIWLVCSPIGIIFSLPAFAVFTGLSQGASLCIKIFRGESFSVAPQGEPQEYVSDSIDEPPETTKAACGTKNYRALAGAILRGAAIVGMWIWFIWVGNHTTGMGSLGIPLIFLPVFAFSVVLFVGALLRISDYYLSVKWASGNVTENTPPVKSRKNPVSIAIQSLLIFVAVALLFVIIGFWADVAIIVVFVILKLVDK